MSSPGSSRRLTRSSVRRCLAGDADEPADCGLKQTSAGISAHQRDGLSSDPGSESEADTVPVHELDSTYADATDDSAAEEYDRVTSAMSDDDAASRMLVRRLAARAADQSAGEPLFSADESSHNEAVRGAGADGDLIESADEDRETVVDVETRQQERNPVPLTSEHNVPEQISRPREVREVVREAARETRQAESTAEPQVVNTGSALSRTAERRDLRTTGPPGGEHARRAGLSIDLSQELVHQLNMRELNLLRREDAFRRRRSRHTRAGPAPSPNLENHTVARETAAGDQKLKKKARPATLKLIPPAVDEDEELADDEICANETEPPRQHLREGGLRLPLFNGKDWAGFMSQFEACVDYYGWTDKTKTIRLYTSIVGDARKTLGSVSANNWTYGQLKKHMEVRYGKSKVYAQIQTELLTHVRKPGQGLHDYHDEIVAVSQTANITETQRKELVHTAFVLGLRGNKHLHRWVTKRELAPTIEAALAAAEDYEDEYGSDTEYHSMPVAVNTRDSTGNPLAVALVNNKASTNTSQTVAVNEVEADDSSLKAYMKTEFKQMSGRIDKKLDGIATRLDTVEKWQSDQVKRWKENAEKRKRWREKQRTESNDSQESDRGQQRFKKNTRERYDSDKKQGSKKQNSKQSDQEINTRETGELSGIFDDEE